MFHMECVYEWMIWWHACDKWNEFSKTDACACLLISFYVCGKSDTRRRPLERVVYCSRNIIIIIIKQTTLASNIPCHTIIFWFASMQFLGIIVHFISSMLIKRCKPAATCYFPRMNLWVFAQHRHNTRFIFSYRSICVAVKWKHFFLTKLQFVIFFFRLFHHLISATNAFYSLTFSDSNQTYRF